MEEKPFKAPSIATIIIRCNTVTSTGQMTTKRNHTTAAKPFTAKNATSDISEYTLNTKCGAPTLFLLM